RTAAAGRLHCGRSVRFGRRDRALSRRCLGIVALWRASEAGRGDGHMTVPSPIEDQAQTMSEANAVSSAVEFDSVSFGFDERIVLRAVSFSVEKGSMKILLGASGAGKSVVLKLILGLLQPDAGTILV